MSSITAKHIVLLALIFFLLNFSSIKAEKYVYQMSSDSRPFIFLEDFGFTNKGRISIQISSFSATSKSNSPRSSHIGFFVAPPPALYSLQAAMVENSCIIKQPFVYPVLTFNEIYIPYQSSFKKTINIKVPDLYYIFFLNCVNGTSVSMNVQLETYNLDNHGSKDYLDERFSNLPTVTFFLAFTYFIFLIFWVRLCYKDKPHLHKIHILMTLLLLSSFLNMFFYAENQLNVRSTGEHNGFNVMWLAFYFIHTMMFVIVVVSIGSGLSLLRPYLHQYQKYMLYLVISLQLIVNVAFIMMRGWGPFYKNYRYWVLVFYFIDFLCNIIIMLPVSDTIETLKETSKNEGKEARNVIRLKLFHNFYTALRGYVYVTRVGIFILRVGVNYKFLWLTIVLEEIIDLVFFMDMFYIFRPSEMKDYIVLADRDEELEVSSMQGSVIDI